MHPSEISKTRRRKFNGGGGHPIHRLSIEPLCSNPPTHPPKPPRVPPAGQQLGCKKTRRDARKPRTQQKDIEQNQTTTSVSFLSFRLKDAAAPTHRTQYGPLDVPREAQLLEGVPQGAVPLRDAPKYAAQRHRGRRYRRRRRGTVLRERCIGHVGGAGTTIGIIPLSMVQRESMVPRGFFCMEEREGLGEEVRNIGCDVAECCTVR